MVVVDQTIEERLRKYGDPEKVITFLESLSQYWNCVLEKQQLRKQLGDFNGEVTAMEARQDVLQGDMDRAMWEMFGST